jgi:hypothetical protein
VDDGGSWAEVTFYVYLHERGKHVSFADGGSLAEKAVLGLSAA